MRIDALDRPCGHRVVNNDLGGEPRIDDVKHLNAEDNERTSGA
jgi:hypothetical protein